MDFARHNAEVVQIWEAYRSGKPLRAPMVLTSVQRIWVLDPGLNKTGITWEQYLNDPRVMFEVSLAHRYHVAHFIPQDAEMGIPEKHWDIWLEFGNVYEEAWLGASIRYPQDQIATTVPCLTGGNKDLLFERGMPGPFDGFMGKIRAFYEEIQAISRGYEFYGRPVRIGHPVSLGTDGPLTVANGLRGTQLFEDMFTDEQYYHRLMEFITYATIARIRAWRDYLGVEPLPQAGFIADDAIQFLSLKTYRDKVLPYHRKLLAALFGPGPHGIHLCGNVQRHFPTLLQELNIGTIDTGFPLDFTTLRDQVGEDVEIQGGVPVGELVGSSPAQIYERSRQILQSGILCGGRFIFKEANDLAPCTPLANLQAMYKAVCDFGTIPMKEV